jgi:hypothetical protein
MPKKEESHSRHKKIKKNKKIYAQKNVAKTRGI